MRKVIEFFIKRPIWGNAFIALILLFGLFSIVTMKRSFFPEMEPTVINVSVLYPGAAPSEMEEGVTIKIEQAVKGLEGIDQINSTSIENMAQIQIKAFPETDMEELLNEIENAINSINSFPQGAERPLISLNKSNGMASVVSFVGVSAKSDSADLTDLIDIATKIERDLLNTKVITQITKTGFPEKEIAINTKETELLRYNISFQEIALAVGSRNIDITTGIIRGGVEEMNVRSNSRVTTADEIGQIVVRTSRDGEKITVADVADVEIGFTEGSQESTYNGLPSVQFQIEKTTDQDITEITEKIREYQEKFNEENSEFSFDVYYEFNKMLNDRIELLSSNGIMGLILVLLFLGLFLNLKLSAWVAFGIPFSFLGMFVIGMAYGMSINMISLFGMILVVGILVDDGIVIAENVYTHYEKGKSAKQAALDGTMEVLPSVFSSVLTTIVAFSILLFVEGMEMMQEMAFVVIACLSFSIFEAFIILPAHLGHNNVLNEDVDERKEWTYPKGSIFMVIGIAVMYFATFLFPGPDDSLGMILFPLLLIILGVLVFLAGYTKSPVERKVRAVADRGIKYVRDVLYKTSLGLIIGKKRAWYILGFAFPLFFTVAIIILMKTSVIGFTFFPDIQPDFINIEAVYMPGDNKAKSDEFVATATEILMEENQRIIDDSGDTLVAYFSSNVGFAQNLGQVGNHASGLMVFLNGENSKTPVDTLTNRIIRRLAETPVSKLAQETFVGGFNRFGKEIELGFSSDDEASLSGARDLFKAELSKVDGIINIKDNMPPGKKEVYLTMRPQADMLGITKSEVLNQVRQGFFGQEAQRVIVGTDEVKIWVRYPLEDRNSFADLENMKIKSMQGVAVPLKEICDFELGRAPEALKRQDGQRIVKIDAESSDPDMVAQINNIVSDSILPKLKQLYPNVQARYLGQVEQTEKTATSMIFVTLIGVSIMFIILTLHFNNLSSAFLIMLVIPAGLAGALLGHGLIGIPVSMLSIFGMIALIGVLVNDAIVFLDRYNDLIVEGYTTRAAVMEAAVSRFRPILLTSLTTIAGLLPLIAEKSMQAQFLIPMAASIAFGILFGTLFILLFFPSAILFWNGYRRLKRYIWTGKWEQNGVDVEPAMRIAIKDRESEVFN